MFPWMLENSLVVLVLSAVAVPVCMLLRSRPALCHVLWLVILVRLVLPPVPVESPAVVRGFVSTAADRLTALVDEGTSLSGSASHDALDERPADPTRVKPMDTPATPTRHAESPGASPALGVLRGLTRLVTSQGVQVAGLVLWILGALAVLVVQIGRCRKLQTLVDQAPEAPASLRRTVAYMANVLDVDVPVVRLLEGLGSPVVWSLGRPVFLWPATGERAAASRCIKGIVAHELAHIRRRDHWVAWFELTAMALCWWNPVFWFVRRRMRVHAEEACDAWAVWALPSSRRAFAEALIDVAEQRVRPIPRAPVLGVTGSEPRDFRKRLRLIMAPHVSHRASPIATGLAMAVALLLLPGSTRPASPDPAPLMASAEVAPATPEVSDRPEIAARLLPAIEARQRAFAAASHTRSGRWAEAAELYQQIVQEEPDNGWALHSLGHALLELGQDSDALPVFERQLSTGVERAEALADIASIHAIQGRSDIALELLDEAVRAGFTDEEWFATAPRLEPLRMNGRLKGLIATAQRVNTLMKAGESAIGGQEWSEAVAAFREARTLCPGLPMATHLLSYSLFGTGGHAEALQVCAEQIEMGYAVSLALYNTACARARLGQLEDSMDALEAAIDNGFDRWSMLAEDADLEALRGTPRMQGLLAEVERRTALWAKAESARESGDWATAAETWRALVDCSSPGGAEHLYLAESLLKAGDSATATEVLEEFVLGSRKGMHEALYLLARSHAMTGESGPALAYLERAVSTGFDDLGRLESDELLSGLRVTHRYAKMLQIVEERDRLESRRETKTEA